MGCRRSHLAKVTSVEWDEGDGAPFVTASWIGGEDDGLQIHIDTLDSTGPTSKLPLSFVFIASAGHQPLTTADFKLGLFGITISPAFKRCGFSYYRAYGRKMSTDAERLRGSSGLLEFDSVALKLANVYASSGEPNTPDDGIPPITEGLLWLHFSAFLQLRDIIKPTGSLNVEAVKALGLNKPPVHPGLHPFSLSRATIHDRAGLKPGDIGVFATKKIQRGQILCVYAGNYITTGEARRGSAMDRYMSVDITPDARDEVIIDPSGSKFDDKEGNVGHYVNDVTVDMANARGQRNTAAFEQNAIFLPFRFFHFPMMAIIAIRDIGEGKEIGVDYGPNFGL